MADELKPENLMGIDMSQVPSVQGYVQSQFASEDPYLQALLGRMSSQEKPLDIYSRLETEAGLPELRKSSSTLSKTIADTEDYLDRVEPLISGRTRDSLVTEAQRTGMVQAEKKPYLENLSKYGTALGRVQQGISQAESNIGTKTSLALQGQEMELEPLKLAYTTMVDRNARKLTGFTADRQTLLDSLFDKLQYQRTLEDREWKLAAELAAEERQYYQNLSTAAAQAGVKLSGNETTEELLSMIGSTVAEGIAWERANKSKSGGGSGGYTTAQKQQYASDIAKYLATEGNRLEGEEAASAMIIQGYPPDLVYEELDRKFPAPKQTAPETTTPQDILSEIKNYQGILENQGITGEAQSSVLYDYIKNTMGLDPAAYGVKPPVEEKKFLGIF